MNEPRPISVALIVAHSGGNQFWARETTVQRPAWECFIVCLCRKTEEEGAPKFYNILQFLRAEGVLDDLDDHPGQMLLKDNKPIHTILAQLPNGHFDLIVTYNPDGAYPRRHEENERGNGMMIFWHSGKISSSELWTFASEEVERGSSPEIVQKKPFYNAFPQDIWLEKYSVISGMNGLKKQSPDVETTPKATPPQQFHTALEALKWMEAGGFLPSQEKLDQMCE